jgi:hypothetical protein
MKTLNLATILALFPVVLAGQERAVDRLREVLPASVAEQVIAIVQEAQSHGLPGDFVADRALEAKAKGRSESEIATAASAMAGQLSAAQDALKNGGRSPNASEIKAAATAQAQGVDGKTISALASSAPSGRSLAVPLAVLGALVSRGLPSDAALKTVQARLAAKASNAELADLPGSAGRDNAAEHGGSSGDNGSHGQASGHVGDGSGSGGSSNGPPEGVPANRGKSGEHGNGRGRSGNHD